SSLVPKTKLPWRSQRPSLLRVAAPWSGSSPASVSSASGVPGNGAPARRIDLASASSSRPSLHSARQPSGSGRAQWWVCPVCGRCIHSREERMSVQYRQPRRSSQTMPSPSRQRLSTARPAVATFTAPIASPPASPFGYAPVPVAPQRVAPSRWFAAGPLQPLHVDLHAQAGTRQRGDAAVGIAAEVVPVEHIVEQVGTLVVVDADALF